MACDKTQNLEEALKDIQEKTPETQTEIWEHIQSCAECERELGRITSKDMINLTKKFSTH